MSKASRGLSAERIQAGLLALALTAAQRRELKKLLGTDALVERVAEAVALHKTEKLIVRDPDAVHATADDYRDLRAALKAALSLLAKMSASTEGTFLGSAENRISHRLMNPIIAGRRVPPPFSMADTKVALIFLEHAVDFILQKFTVSKGGRPHKRGELLFSFVEEIVRDSGKRSAKALPGVLRIALEAGGEDAEECDRLLDRIKRGRAPDRRTNRPKP